MAPSLNFMRFLFLDVYSKSRDIFCKTARTFQANSPAQRINEAFFALCLDYFSLLLVAEHRRWKSSE